MRFLWHFRWFFFILHHHHRHCYCRHEMDEPLKNKSIDISKEIVAFTCAIHPFFVFMCSFFFSFFNRPELCITTIWQGISVFISFCNGFVWNNVVFFLNWFQLIQFNAFEKKTLKLGARGTIWIQCPCLSFKWISIIYCKNHLFDS